MCVVCVCVCILGFRVLIGADALLPHFAVTVQAADSEAGAMMCARLLFKY